jgi:hypothetical protein
MAGEAFEDFLRSRLRAMWLDALSCPRDGGQLIDPPDGDLSLGGWCTLCGMRRHEQGPARVGSPQGIG